MNKTVDKSNVGSFDKNNPPPYREEIIDGKTVKVYLCPKANFLYYNYEDLNFLA